MTPTQMNQRLNFRGADPRSRKQLEDALVSLQADWPGVQPREVTCVHLDKGVHGSTNNAPMHGFGPGEQVEVNKDDMAHLDAWMAYIRADGSGVRPDLRKWVEMHPAAYTIEHEFGHVLHGHLYGEIRPDSPPMLKLAKAGFVACGAAPKDTSETAIMFGWALFGLGANILAKDLSPYGATLPPEMVAEAFAIDRHEPGKSKAASAVMEIIRHDYHKKFGHQAA